jgi:hypothetical protein
MIISCLPVQAWPSSSPFFIVIFSGLLFLILVFVERQHRAVHVTDSFIDVL